MQWLDNLERTDPEGYQQLLATMKAQIESGSAGMPAPPPQQQQQRDADAALFEMLGSAAKSSGARSDASDFTPRFPGNKVMEANGLATKQEGVRLASFLPSRSLTRATTDTAAHSLSLHPQMYIDVQPGFVMKTRETKTGKKVRASVAGALMLALRC